MTNNPLANLSLQQLKRAVTIREKISALEKELGSVIGSPVSTAKRATRKRKGRLSAAAKARISAAMKARWAKIKAQKARK